MIFRDRASEPIHGTGSASRVRTDGGQRADPTVQSHGSHWDTVVAGRDRETAIQDTVMMTVRQGDPVNVVDRDDTEIQGFRLGDGPVGAVAVSVDGRVATAYPVVEGVTHGVEFEALNEWETGIEAWVRGALGEATVTAFAGNYFARPKRDFGGECTASLSLLAYDLGLAEDDALETDDNAVDVDLSEFAGFIPLEGGAPDDFVVRTEVEAVTRVDGVVADGYRLRVPLFRAEDGEGVDVALFVADHVLGDYVPAVGDSVEGPCWLQAWVH